jgi:hypothetical protein
MCSSLGSRISCQVYITSFSDSYTVSTRQSLLTHTKYQNILHILNILTRVTANRLNPWLDTLLNPSQHCGLRGHTILEAIANIRDAIAYAEYSGSKLCIASLDFKEAFDDISHHYPFTLLRTYGFSTQIRRYIQDIYTNFLMVFWPCIIV